MRAIPRLAALVWSNPVHRWPKKPIVYLGLSSVLAPVALIAATGAATQMTAASGPAAETPRMAQAAEPAGGHDEYTDSPLTRPSRRFTGNGDGTVTDNRTGLIWLQDASCAELPKTDERGRAYGATAVSAAAELADPDCGLSDGSQAGDWRLPSRFELESLLDLEFHGPALSNTAGTARWAAADPFSGVEPTYYWTSSTLASDPLFVWCVDVSDGVVFYAYEVNYYYVWPVRGGS